jgi:hypothetical protein
VMCGAGVEAPPVSLVAVRAVADEGVCFWLVMMEESRWPLEVARCSHVP